MPDIPGKVITRYNGEMCIFLLKTSPSFMYAVMLMLLDTYGKHGKAIIFITTRLELVKLDVNYFFYLASVELM